MSTQNNKAIVTQFCERLSAADIPGVLALMSDDVSYWILGRKDVIRSSGPHTKTQMERIFTIMHQQLKDGIRFTAENMIVEGDEIALEAESHGELKNGRIYNNQYCIRMRIRDGKIAEAREYLDTQHVHAVWYA